MAKNKVVVAQSVTAAMMKDFWRQIAVRSITSKQLHAFLEHRNPFADFSAKPETSMDLTNQLVSWRNILTTYFGVGNYNPERIPVRGEGEQDFTRLIVVPQGLTLKRALEGLCTLFHVQVGEHAPEMSQIIKENPQATHDRMPDKTYAVWVRDNREPDKEFRGLSGLEIKERNIKTVTLLEYLLLELKYYSETGKHMSVKFETLCAGTHWSYGVTDGSSGSYAYAKYVKSRRRLTLGVNYLTYKTPEMTYCARQVVD
jgi:hypothetical protein